MFDDLGGTASAAMVEAKQAHSLLVKSTGLLLTAGVVSIGQVKGFLDSAVIRINGSGSGQSSLLSLLFPSQALELSLSVEEVEVLETAVENADRFYRVQWKGMDSSDADAERAADAFKAVSQVGHLLQALLHHAKLRFFTSPCCMTTLPGLFGHPRQPLCCCGGHILCGGALDGRPVVRNREPRSTLCRIASHELG